MKKELDGARKRIVDLIKEKTELENTMVTQQMKNSQTREDALVYSKRVKEFEVEHQELTNRFL